MSVSPETNVGVIGAGNMGRHHVRNYAEISSSNIVALADPHPEKEALALEHGINYYTDYEEMLDKEDLEAVSIALPTPLHFEVTSKTLMRGISALVEKPIATSPEEGRKLIQIAEDNEAILTVGHIERFNPVVKTIKRIVNAGQIGRIISINTTRIGGLPANEPKSDVITDLAIHDLDIMRYLTDKKLELVGAHGSQTYHSAEIDSAQILVSSNGTDGVAQANWVTPDKIRSISVTGEKGFLMGNYVNQTLDQVESALADIQRTEYSYEEYVEALGNPIKKHVEIINAEPLRGELETFLGAVISGDTANLIPAEEAIDALELALAAKEDALRRLHG